MTPEWITEEYIEACRKARHVQGWWSATWMPGRHEGQGFVTCTSENGGPLIADHGSRAAWALPPVGQGMQANVRVGDFFCNTDWVNRPEDKPRAVVISGQAGVGLWRGPSNWMLTLGDRVPDQDNVFERGTHVPLEHMAFIPRLDQLLWMWGGWTGKATHFLRGEGVFLAECPADVFCHMPPLLELVELADAHLATLGCPAREVT